VTIFQRYTPEEFENFVRQEPSKAVEWLRQEIEQIDNEDLMCAAKAMFLLVLVSQSLRVLIPLVDAPDVLGAKLARLSILMDDRITEMFHEWLGEDAESTE
jgi:hypothetical protein